MKKLGLVCEGGGTRGSYTAGVLAWFLDNNIPVDYAVGISAGAFTLQQYVSKQKERMRLTSTDYVADPRYLGWEAIKAQGEFVGLDFVFDEIPKMLPIDYDTFYANPIEFEYGVFNVQTGELEYYGKDSLKDNYEMFKTSCRLPIFSKMGHYNGYDYLDGGVKNMIPIYRAEEKGIKHNIVILTKPENYIRKPEAKWQLNIVKMAYGKKAKKVLENLNRRHIEFKEEIDHIYEEQAKGNVLVLRPSKDLHISRMTRDAKLLNEMYELGYSDCEMRREMIMKFVEKATM